VHHLPRDELGDREPDDIDGLVDVGDDTSHLCAGEAARFGAQAEHDLVAVDGVDVKVDGDSGGSGCLPANRGVPCSTHAARWG
jgi:hypothetical protein